MKKGWKIGKPITGRKEGKPLNNTFRMGMLIWRGWNWSIWKRFWPKTSHSMQWRKNSTLTDWKIDPLYSNFSCKNKVNPSVPLWLLLLPFLYQSLQWFFSKFLPFHTLTYRCFYFLCGLLAVDLQTYRFLPLLVFGCFQRLSTKMCFLCLLVLFRLQIC